MSIQSNYSLSKDLGRDTPYYEYSYALAQVPSHELRTKVVIVNTLKNSFQTPIDPKLLKNWIKYNEQAMNLQSGEILFPLYEFISNAMDAIKRVYQQLSESEKKECVIKVDHMEAIVLWKIILGMVWDGVK